MSECIAALSTGLSTAGIAIIRVSGDLSTKIVDNVYIGMHNLTEVPTHTVHYGFIVDKSGKKIDEVLITVMLAPRTYTREDVVEISCHGNPLVIRKILSTLYEAGARPAEPGEFTKRAFLNGRLDLAQAESVMDLIGAQSEFSRKNALKELSGVLTGKIQRIRETLIHETAYIEAALDDPEHYELQNYGRELDPKIEVMIRELEALSRSFTQGKLLSSGVKTVILGLPNAGKSSLMNVLMNRDRAIVSDIAGTTRDTLEETVSIGEVTLRLVDTAGIRESFLQREAVGERKPEKAGKRGWFSKKQDGKGAEPVDPIEEIGQERAKAALEDADLVLILIDGSTHFSAAYTRLFELAKGKRSICILNKCDLEQNIPQVSILREYDGKVLHISTKTLEGIAELKATIEQMFVKGQIFASDDVFLTNERQKAEIDKAISSLSLVRTSIMQGMPEDMYLVDLLDAYRYTGLVIGEAVEDDLVDRIFSEFCMGK